MLADTELEVVPSRVQRHARRRPLGLRLPSGPAGWRTLWRHHHRVLAVAAGIVVIGGAGLTSFRIARDGTLPNLELDGIPVGSMDEDGLRAAVERAAAKRAAARITLTRPATASAPEDSIVAVVSDTGYEVDVDATVEAIQDRGRQWNPLAALIDHVRATFGAVEVGPVDSFDQPRLDAWVRVASVRLSVPPTEGSLSFNGAVVTRVSPAPGAEVLEEEVRAAVQKAARNSGAGPVSISGRPSPPKTTAEDVRQVLVEARQALSGPVHLIRGTERLTFTPKQIGEALVTELVVDGGEVRLQLAGNPLGIDLRRKALQRVETDPVDATFKVSGDSIRVVRSKKGFRFDPQQAADQLVAAALSDSREARLRGERVEPELTTAEAKELRITEQVATFTTYHACCESRVTNIHRMADLLDGTVVLPGEILSVNEVVGERTEENGFVRAPAIREGAFVEEVGGGISQFATTMFNAIFFGGYDFLEYKAHSYYFDRYPVGREATVSWPSPDLRFLNDSDAGIYIDTSYDDISVTVSFYSSTDAEVEAVTGKPYNYRDPPVKCEENKNLEKGKVEVVQEGDVGFDVVVERVFHFASGRTETERFFTHYRAEPRIEEHRSCD
jgi:vancomycin resistance protein YoaR